MPNVLTDAQIAQYKRENFLAPFPALTKAETRHYRDCLENYERTQGGAPLEPWQYRKLHVREEWAADLVRIPRVLDAVDAALQRGDATYVDRTNVNKEQRAHWVRLAKRHGARCVTLEFRTPADLCAQRCEAREHHEGGVDRTNRECRRIVRIMSDEFTAVHKPNCRVSATAESWPSRHRRDACTRLTD